MWRSLAAALLLALIAGCADKAPVKPPEPVVEAPPPVVEKKPVDEGWYTGPLKHLAGRDLKPMETRPLNVKSRCAHRDAVGTLTKLDLLVREAEVKRFDAKVSMKGKGTCSFNLKNFEQKAKLPQALLLAKDGSDCSVRMWEQGQRVTVAFSNCAKSCEQDAFSYLWPIMVEAKSGQCF